MRQGYLIWQNSTTHPLHKVDKIASVDDRLPRFRFHSVLRPHLAIFGGGKGIEITCCEKDHLAILERRLSLCDRLAYFDTGDKAV